MSLGILDVPATRSRNVKKSLGSEPPPDQWCWTYPGFTDCHNANWAKINAQQQDLIQQHDVLKVPGATPPMTSAQFDDAVYVLDNTRCDCPALDPNRNKTTTATTTTAAALTYGNSTPNAQTTALQNEINIVFVAHGLKPITADGKLGAGTCGAARYADQNFGTTLQAKYGLSVCKAYTSPVATTVATKAPVTTSAAPTTAAASTSAVSTQTMLIVGALAAGAYFVFGRKKKAA